MRFLKTLLFTIIIPISLVAQKNLLESITIEDGLSQGMIFDIMQDSDGFMWFATKNGLNRYDGYEFRIFSHDPFDSLSISGDVVFCIFEDSQGKLWVGTQNGGLNYYDKYKAQFLQLADLEVELETLRKSTVYEIVEDKEGHLWCASSRGVYRLKTTGKFPRKNESIIAKKYELKTATGLPVSDVSQICYTSQNELLVANILKGVWKWTAEKDVFEPISIPASKTPHTIKDIFEYPENTFWISTLEFIVRLSEDNIHAFKISDISPVKEWTRGVAEFILNPKTDKVWFGLGGTPNLFFFDPNLAPEEVVFRQAMVLDKEDSPRSLWLDSLENLWIGTEGYGLKKASLKKNKFKNYAEGKSLRSIYQTQNQDIFYSTNKFLERAIPGTDDIKPISKQGNDFSHFYNLIQTKDGTIWAIGPKKQKSRAGLLFRLNAQYEIEEKYDLKHYPDYYRQLVEDNFSNILFACENSVLGIFNRKTENFNYFDYKHLLPDFEGIHNSSAFYQDGQGSLWIGKTWGLVRVKFNEEGEPQSFKLFKNEPSNRNSLSSNSIASCLDDPFEPEEFLWIGTKGGGLNKFNKKTGEVIHFSTKDGLPDNVVYGILPDEDHNLWLSTNRGISKYNLIEQTFQNYKAADGLQHDEFNTNAFFKNEQTGELFFGGINGITAFFPKEIQATKFKPKVYITNLQINGEEISYNKELKDKGKNPLNVSIEYTEKIELAWFQNQITLEFAALDYRISEKNRYKFRLSPINKDWISANKSRIANYANLAPGEYLFEVKGSNSSVIWNEEATQLKIVIQPPWWKTTWAYGFYVFVFIAGIFVLYRFQINRANLRNQLAFEHREAERLAELDRIKSNFFSNITHEFRTPLTLILEPIRQILKEIKSDRLTQKLKLVQSNSLRLLQLVNQLLDLSKLESQQMTLDLHRGDILEVIRPIYQSFLPLAEKKGIQLGFKHRKDLPYFFFDKNKVEKVVYNILSNALKFTSVGSVQCEVSSIVLDKPNKLPATNCLLLTVKDTGFGIPQSEVPKIFDRFYQVDASSTRTGEGTGIGLALTKELVELMGGEIEVESELGLGTKFLIKLPMVSSSEFRVSQGDPLVAGSEMVQRSAPSKIDQSSSSLERDIPAQSSRKYSTSNPELQTLDSKSANKGSRELILLIEDNAELRQFLQQSLENKYQIIEASNGAEGIRKGLELLPDLIISDLMMPEKDGFEVMNVLKNDEKSSHIPIILLTARTAIESKIKGLKRGADVYLTKPFHLEVLEAHIENQINLRFKLREKYAAQSTQPIQKRIELFDTIENQFLRKLMRTVESHIENENLSSNNLAQQMFMSRSQLHRKLKALTNQSTTEFVRNYRLDRAMELLKNREGTVTEISIQVGFSNQKYFSTRFKEKFGFRPSEV